MLNNKPLIVITGGTRGLGLNTEIFLSKLKWNLVLLDISDKACMVYHESKNIKDVYNKVYNDNLVEFMFGVGGTDKKNSSSELVKVERDWGYWQVLKDYGTSKVKELTIFPGKKISYQRHFKRSELWFVIEGECTIRGLRENAIIRPSSTMKLHAYQNISVGMWHDIKNHTDELCRIVEIQYGEACEEIDIERHK